MSADLMSADLMSADSARADRMPVYRLYHALELWDWFAVARQAEPPASLADDMRAIIEAA
jgi:hypothetical protein